MTTRTTKYRQGIEEANRDAWAVRNACGSDGSPYMPSQRRAFRRKLIRQQKLIWGTWRQRRFWDYSPVRLSAYIRTMQNHIDKRRA